MEKRYIRFFPFIAERILNNAEDFPNLLHIMQEERKRMEAAEFKISFNHASMYVPKDDPAVAEYEAFLNKHCPVELPENDEELWLTTDDGGKFVGFYKDGRWQYHTLDGQCDVTGRVILVEPYEYHIKKEDLDKRICDVEKRAQNTQTYREFIQESEREFGMKGLDLDKLNNRELRRYLDHLDELWNK